MPPYFHPTESSGGRRYTRYFHRYMASGYCSIPVRSLYQNILFHRIEECLQE